MKKRVKESKRVLALLREAKAPEGTVVQALLFGKETFSPAQAKEWALGHDFKAGAPYVTEEGETIHVRQRDPETFVPKGMESGESFATIALTEGVQAVIGRLKEMAYSEDSLEGRMEQVRNAYYEQHRQVYGVSPDSPSFYVEETHDDHLIVCKGDQLFTVPYTVTADGTVTFGEAKEVERKVSFTAKESIRVTEGAAHFLESASTDGSEWLVRLIKPGWSKNRSAALKLPRYYPEATLQEAAPRFEGVRAFAHEQGPHVNDPSQRRAQDVVGWFSGPKYDAGIVATFTCIDPPLRTKLKEAWDRGKRDLLGFSIDAPGREEPRIVEGKRAAWVAEIQTPYSTDVVTDPAAGGELMRLVASADGPEKEDAMDRLLEMIRAIKPELVATVPDGGWTDEKLKAMLKEALAAAKQPENAGTPIVDATRLTEVEKKLADYEAKEQRLGKIQRFREALATHPVAQFPKAKGIVERFGIAEIEAGKELTAESIKTMADEQMTVLAEASQSGKVTGLGTAHVSKDEREKVIIHAMDGMFEGKDMGDVPKFNSLHEAYCRITGKVYHDLDNRAIFQESIGKKDYDSHSRRLTESIVSTDWAEILGDSITRKLIRDYKQSSQYDAWRSIVSEISSPKDFRTQRRMRLGGYGVLPAVGQGAPYQPLTSPGDEESTFTPTKRGGTEDLTWETVLNDDVSAIRQIPVRLARSAKITLYRFVMDFLLTNPAIYDGVTLFHAATHGNLRTTALAGPALLTAENDMLAQTAYGEATNNLGLAPRYLMTVRALRDTAFKLLTGDVAVIAAETATVPNIFKGKYRTWQGGESGEPFHVCNYDTSTTRYVLIADPMEIPTFEIGFLGGQQEPELFVQDDERVGSRFSADKITYKIRHVYSGAVLDYRGFAQGNS